MKRFGWFDEKGAGAWVLLLVLVVLLAATCPVWAGAGSKADTGSTSAYVLFGPDKYAGHSLEYLAASSDKAASQVVIWERGGAGKIQVSAAPTNGQATVSLDNSGYALTNSDTFVYVYSDGTLDLGTISGATTTYITPDTAMGQDGSTEDYIYELQAASWIELGTNALTTDGLIWRTDADSPLYIVVDGTATSRVSATVR